MKKLNILSVLFLSLIFSCSTDNNEQLESFNVKENYEKIINSQTDNQTKNSSNDYGIDIDSYEALTDNQKTQLWDYKYQLFEDSNKLSDKQIQMLNEVKEFSSNAILNGSFDEDVANALDLSAQEVFTIDQYVALMYYLDNPIAADPKQKATCFWCFLIGESEPCRIVVEDGITKAYKRTKLNRVRLFINFGHEGYIDLPCTDEEVFEDIIQRNVE